MAHSLQKAPGCRALPVSPQALEHVPHWGKHPSVAVVRALYLTPISGIPRMSPGRHFCVALFAFALIAALSAGPAAAQDRRVPSSAAELRLSYAPLVKRVAPAVVNVYAARVVENRNPLMDDPVFRRFFGQGVPREQVQRSLGSGVIVDATGFIVTTNHVIEGATEIKISLADKREFEADIVLKDSRTDLAVLRVKDRRERFPALEFGNSDELQVGDVVLAIGNP